MTKVGVERIGIRRPDGTAVRDLEDRDVTDVETSAETLAHFGIGEHDGYRGLFSRQRADGALPNGTRIVKTLVEEGDGHVRGAPGVVLGSIRANGPRGVETMYFVEWDDMPRTAVGTMADKIEAE